MYVKSYMFLNAYTYDQLSKKKNFAGHYKKEKKNSLNIKILSELNSDISRMLDLTYKKLKIIMLSMLTLLIKIKRKHAKSSF